MSLGLTLWVCGLSLDFLVCLICFCCIILILVALMKLVLTAMWVFRVAGWFWVDLDFRLLGLMCCSFCQFDFRMFRLLACCYALSVLFWVYCVSGVFRVFV